MNRDFGLISIIMAAYNAEHTIEEAINSVINQTYTNWELIVVNDCSSDNTVNLVENFCKNDIRIKLINNVKNCGVSKTRHNGLEKTNGDWIAILDSDDFWSPDKLEKQVNLQLTSCAELLYTGSSFMDENSRKMSWILSVPVKVNYQQLLKQNIISNSSVLVKKNLYENFEAMGDNMHEDFACWLKILRTGICAYGVNEPLLTYRVSINSKSGNKFKSFVMNWKTYRYIGLNILESVYYMFFYTINGIKKYRNLK